MASAQTVNIKSTEFQPKNEYILVKPDELQKEKTTESGIVLQINQSSIDRPTSGEVIEVGKDIDDIEVGSFIMWPATDGIDLSFEDGEFMLLRYKSVIGSKK